jgi:hypothetical protein
MDAQTSFDLFAHFDRPAKVVKAHTVPTRGIRWVLIWAAALGVLFVAASVLIEFTYCLAAEHAIARAARAGAVEATLPRATYDSIAQSVARRLERYSLPTSRLRLSVEQNGHPISSHFAAHAGDQFSVAVSLPTTAVLPQWLQRALIWRPESHITAKALSRIPSRELHARTSY